MSTTELIVNERRSAALATQDEREPLMAFMERLASNPSLDVEKIDKLMNVYISGQRKMAEMRDEQQYYLRMAEFKQNPPRVLKELTAKIQGIAKGSGREYSYEVKYADLNAYADAAMAALAERGITWDFDVTNTPKEITVTCVLHYGLYSRRGATLTSGPDESGAKNAIQSQGSAQSFLMRYSFCASTGLTAALPPDKNGVKPAAQAPPISEEDEAKLQEWADALRQCDDLAQLKSIFADAYKFAKATGELAKQQITRVYNECKARLQ